MESENETSLWSKVKVFFASPSFEDEEKSRIAALLNTILLGITALVVMIVPVSLFLPGTYIQHVLVLLVVAAFTIVLWLMMQRRRIRAASIALVGLFLAAGTYNVYIAGTIRVPMAALFVLSVMIARLLINNRALIIVTSLSIAILLGLNIAEIYGLLPPVQQEVRGFSVWLVWVGILSMSSVLLGLAGTAIEQSLDAARRSAAKIRGQSAYLEILLEEQSEELERREAYLGATTVIAHEAASMHRNLQALLRQVVNVISDRFGFYHTGIFVVDPSGEYAVLQAASSEIGEQMRERGYQLHIDSSRYRQSLVVDVARQGQYRIVSDAYNSDTSDLPETRSEIALPLHVRDEIIGVLDVHSVKLDAFSAEDVSVLQALADQIAMAISNARLFRQVEEGIEAERRVYGELTQEAWRDLLQTRSGLAFASGKRGIIPFDAWEPKMKEAVQTGEIVAGSEIEEQATSQVLALPIRVRDEVVGVIDGRKSGDAAWTEEEIDLLETLTEQLGVALESARLYEDTQRRAAREQLTGEVTARIRETLDVNEVLQTATREMRRVLDLAEVEIRMGLDASEKE